MAKKQKPTKTTNPIHFEDLDPHRFEDLVRQLLYDLKDWANIEPTGKGGSDDGYDVRAYEKNHDTDTDTDTEDSHPMDGNMWMVQCKRERALGPKRVKEIIEEDVKGDIPYGFILAAPTNFSKKSYDIFREELRKKGVMEFYLWGKQELEDMLYLPKNDRVLFTFFGISLVSRRRSRATQVRSVVTTKNKLKKILPGGRGFGHPVLVRDIKDEHYPYGGEYPDFEKNPRWKQYYVSSHHALGLILTVHRYHAYFDINKSEWDFCSKLDLLPREHEEDSSQETDINGFSEMIPNANRATLVDSRLIQYEDILVIDDIGDESYNMPHIFVDFEGKHGPFSGDLLSLKRDDTSIDFDIKKAKRIEYFPTKIPTFIWGKVHKKPIELPKDIVENLTYYSDSYYQLLSPTDRKLKPLDVINIVSDEENGMSSYFQIKTTDLTTVSKYKKKQYVGNPEYVLKSMCGEVSDKDKIHIYELRKVYERQFSK